MKFTRDRLTLLFNRLHDLDVGRISVKHPADEIGELLTVELGAPGECTVRFTTDRDAYAEALGEIRQSYGNDVADDLPDPSQYVKTAMASGIVPVENYDEVRQYVDRHGDPDLTAGHPPVMAGFDTNLLSWRIDRILGLRDPDDGVGYVNGFVLATGVRDELDWDYKCHDTRQFEEAFGSEFEEYWNQPLGAARIGRLGMNAYRNVRDIQTADEIESDRGDESIVAAYDEYNRQNRQQVLLFSNDRNFVERARSHTLFAQRVEFPSTLPRTATASWDELELLLYELATAFGVLTLPKVTVFGVWRGKEALDWQHARLMVDCRSPKIESLLETDRSVVASFEELADR